MKIKTSLIAVVSALMMLIPSTQAIASEVPRKKITVRQEITLNTEPYILDDQIMIPLRSFAESLNCRVTWNGSMKEIKVHSQTKELYSLHVGSDKAKVSGQEYALKNKVTLINGTSFVEADFLRFAHGIEFDENSIEIQKYSYVFEKDTLGFEAIFADYHYDPTGNYDIYELTWDYREIPVEGRESMGLYIASHNRSDDIFMGYFKEISGLEPNREYTFDVEFLLATDVEGGLIGIGGPPGEAVFVKCGASTVKPEVVLENNNFRINIDKGAQSDSGKAMRVIGNMAKPNGAPEGFVFKRMEASFSVKTDSEGRLYLIIGTDSGFEGFTEYYIDDVTLAIK
ncbi:MAG TPA: copper amine oxidase N-terminal domain-containing protein [Clostridiales bacterium]|nr:copper amine oxidase N-terminal domain-containing protein [Clostridiales bacterium]